MSTSDQDDGYAERARTQTESQAATAAHEIGVRAQSEQVHQKKHNPEFYEKYTKTDLQDSRKWGHLVDQYRPWLADDHVLSNRRQVYRLQRELLNKARVEQAVAGATPGIRLKEKPLLNALAQGINPELENVVALDAPGQSAVEITDPEYEPPMDAQERSVMDDIGNLATARQAMGVDQAGSEALTTATTEQKTVREDETEESSAVSSISGVF